MARRLAFLLLTVAVAALGVIVLEPGDVEAGAYPVPQGSYQGCDGGRPGSVCGTFPGRDGSLQIAACPNGQGPVMSGGIWTCAASSASSTCHFDGGTGLVALGQDGGSICVPVPLQPYVISTVDASSGSVICSTSGGNAHWCPNVTTTGCDAGEVVGNIEAGIPHCIASTSPTYPIAETLGGTGANLGAGACPAGSVVQGTSGSAMTCNAFSGGVTVGSTGTTTVTGGSSATSAWAMSKGGLGQALTCASGNLLLATSTTLAQCAAMSGDCTISATGVVTCSGLQNQEIVAGASTGTLTCAAGATACGEAQASTSSVTPAPMAFKAQQSTNANGNASSGYLFELGTPAGTSTTEGFFTLIRNGVIGMQAGPFPTTGGAGNGFWFGNKVPSTSNYNFLDYSNIAILNESAESRLAVQGTPIISAFATGATITAPLTLTNSTVVASPTSVTIQGVSGAFDVTPAGAASPTFSASSTATTVTTPFDLTSIGTLSSGSATGGSIVESYNGNVWAFGEQATSLPITPTLVAPGYLGTLNATAMTGGGTTPQSTVRESLRYVGGFAGGAATGTVAFQMPANPDSISATYIATITCTAMTAGSAQAVGDTISQTSTQPTWLPHSGGTVALKGTAQTSTAIGTTNETAAAAWTANGTSAVVTWTISTNGGAAMGADKCTGNVDAQYN